MTQVALTRDVSLNYFATVGATLRDGRWLLRCATSTRRPHSDAEYSFGDHDWTQRMRERREYSPVPLMLEPNWCGGVKGFQ